MSLCKKLPTLFIPYRRSDNDIIILHFYTDVKFIKYCWRKIRLCTGKGTANVLLYIYYNGIIVLHRNSGRKRGKDMLDFILGAAGSGKTCCIYDRISKENSEAILLVPDQFVFESERRMAQATDEKKNDISVTGFSALSEQILKKYCSRKSYADITAKTAIMLRTVRELQGTLKFYGGAAGKQGFAAVCLSAVNMLKNSGISCETLSEAAEKEEGFFKDKLSDITAIYRLYDKMLGKIYDDRQDNLVLAAQAAEENDCFAGISIYIDGFDSFTGAQKRFLEPMIRQSDNCTVALCTDQSGSDVFLMCEKTKEFFIKTASCENAEIIETVLSDTPRYKNESIRILRDELCSESGETGSTDGITAAFSRSMSSESDYVCSQIRKLVRSEGYRYSDIAVICASPSAYASTFVSAAMRYDIPVFADLPQPISEKPLLRFFDCLFAAATKPVGTNIMRYIKSGFARIPSEKGGGTTRPVTLRERHLFEEYATYWDLKDKSWNRPFPKIDKDDDKTVEHIREQIVTPLVRFAREAQNKDGRELTKLFTQFLFEKVDIRAAIQGQCQDNSTRDLKYVKEKTEEYNNLWGTVSEMLSSLYDTLDGMPMTIDEYALTLRTCASQINLSRPPKVLDSILFGDIARTRSKDVRAVFVMGASEGAFPNLTAAETAMLTLSDIEKLRENEIVVSEDEETEYSRAMLDVYKALSLPEEKLWVTFTGERDSGAECFKVMDKAFGTKLINIDKEDPLVFCESVRSAEKQYVRCVNGCDNSDKADIIFTALKECNKSACAGKFEAIADKQAKGAQEHRIKDIAPLVFPPRDLSPTAIEMLNGCKFAYFCRYGLALKSASDITMNSGNYGNIMHYIMKYSLERLYADTSAGSNPHVTEEEIIGLIKEAMDEYRQKFLLPESEMSVRFNTLYDSMAKTAYYILLYMTAELEKSSFRPMYFELTLEQGKDVGELSAEPYSFEITMPDNTTQRVCISGTVDRVDIAQSESGRQLRVIDYKTGPKEADMNRVYYGLDLQLLLYLFALSDNNDLVPSAAVYYPAGKTPLKDIKAPSDELKRGIWLDTHREGGFAVEGTVYEAERENYRSVKLDKDGKEKATDFYSAVTVNSDKLDRLKGRVLEVVKDNLTEIKSGNVSAIPLVQDNTVLACKYCEYLDVCGISYGKCRDVKSNEAEMFAVEVIKQEVKKGKNGGR